MPYFFTSQHPVTSIKRTHNNKNLGFTLIEVLVVVIIIGVMISVVSYRSVPADPKDLLQENIDVFKQKMQFGLDYATFNTKVLAVTVHPNGYYFSDYHIDDPSKTWHPLTDKKELTPQHWKNPKVIEDVVLNIEGVDVLLDDLEDSEGKLDKKKVDKQDNPHIQLFPNYETNEFDLILVGEEAEEAKLESKKISLIDW